MSSTVVRYLTMLRMVPRFPNVITTTELAQRLEEQDFSVTMRSIQRDLEKPSADFPLLTTRVPPTAEQYPAPQRKD